MYRVDKSLFKSTVYFDGSCPLCQAEIGYYCGQDKEGAFCFVDVSKQGATTPDGVTQQQAMKRLHVLAQDGHVRSGAAAFVEIWAHLPKWRWAARVASLPEALTILEVTYRMFLPVRPIVSRCFARLIWLRAAIDRAGRG
jgi:predicted DCC family thiol-disulfide oxidoreductase YuxK